MGLDHFEIQVFWRLSMVSKQTQALSGSLEIQGHNLVSEFPSFLLGKMTWGFSEPSRNNSAQGRQLWPIPFLDT